MIRLAARHVILALALASLVAIRPAEEQKPIVGRVSRVIDGDTIKVSAAGIVYTVRLDAIDAPEISQEHGKAARDNLKSLLLDKAVTVRWSKRDRYGRIIGRVYRKDSLVNLSLVEDGHAWHYKDYSSDQAYASAETSAKDQKIGLWKSSNRVAPWEYRKAKRAAGDKKKKESSQ